MKKALLYASVASMIQQFNMDNISILLDLGYQVDVACNFKQGSSISDDAVNQLKMQLKNMGIQLYQIDIPRKLSDVKNLKKSYLQTLDVMNHNQYSIVHCHSPIGGFICRLAASRSDFYSEMKVIYTAHGFHFYKGNRWINNQVFFSAEKLAAKYTDMIITINQEDYIAAHKFRLRENGKIQYIPGVGIDTEKIYSVKRDKEKLCDLLHIDHKSFLMVSVGEVNKNKNHKIIVDLLPRLPENIHYIICGKGDLIGEYEESAAKAGTAGRLHLLGYRQDVIEIVKSCDVFLFPSIREGLGLAALEGMAAGLPIITSNGRGICDYSIDGKTGFSCHYNDSDGFYAAIMKIAADPILAEKFGKYNITVVKRFDIKKVSEKMREIYSSI